METVQVKSRSRNEWIDVTGEVQSVVTRSGMRSGLCVLHVPHTTAAVTVNEGADPSVRSDVLDVLTALAPREGAYRHAEGNADAHAKSCLLGVDQTLLVHQGKLVLGTWQAVFFCEFDGPRTRRLLVQTLHLPDA